MSNSNIYINEGLEVLTSILQKESAKRIFLVAGKDAFASVRDVIETLLEDRAVNIFDDFEENPNIKNISDGIIAYNDFSPNLVMAVGGGTAIDIAKAVNILAVQNKNFEEIIKGNEFIDCKPSVPLVVMPTTAGTGSEATHFSVVYIDKNKYSLAHKYMIPDYVILDHYLVRTMPKYVAACTAFDALSQAVESYWSRNATSQSRSYSSEAIQLILNSIPISVDNPLVENRTAMIKAAYLAGCAINLTKTTAPHAISYSLTSYYGIPHGHAVAMLLGYTAVISCELCDEKQGSVFCDIFRMFNCLSAGEFYGKWVQLMLSCGLNTKLSDFGIDANNAEIIINGINTERMAGHPVALNKDMVKRIIEHIL